MKEPIDLGREGGLKLFSTTLAEVFASSLMTVIQSQPEIAIQETFRCSAQDVISSYENSVFLAATEEKTGFEAGLLFSMRDITIMADMMLMGEGEPKADLDSELKDAITELGSQLFAGITVPLEGKIGKKLQFKIDEVSKLQSTAMLQADKYFVVDMDGKLKGAPFHFRFFVDDGISSVIDANSSGGGISSPNVLNTADFFGVGGDSLASTSSYSGSSNMDILVDIEVPVSVKMGSAKLFLKDVLGLGPGNIVELDQNADDMIELTVNGKLIARGEVVIVDGYFGFRIREIISKAERIKKLKD